MHDPICTNSGNLEEALHGSFLPIPDKKLFPLEETSLYAHSNAPGAVIVKRDAAIIINANRDRVRLRVTNTGDRPIQVGSHYHFIETNAALNFDRALAYGKRLDIPAGTAVRFEPGDIKSVTLVAIGGKKIISGGNGLATGPFDPSRTDAIVSNLLKEGFGHTPQPGASSVAVEPKVVSRETWLGMFGPTTGDRIRLGDTDLWVEVERDMVRPHRFMQNQNPDIEIRSLSLHSDDLRRRVQIWRREDLARGHGSSDQPSFA